MGAIPSQLGIGDSSAGGSGLRFKASGVDLQKPVTNEQATSAYGRTQEALDAQNAFVQALQAQNGISNQSNVYNQLAGVASGQGPNPALNMLNQATSANIANQAALMAGQRGSTSNPGLIARQAGMQGGALQQQAVGQGATMQANQSLNALNTMGNIAGQQVSNLGSNTNAYSQGAQGEQQNLLNGINNQNNAAVAMQSNINNANAGIAGIAAKGQQELIGKITGAAGSAAGMAHGGIVPQMYAEGGAIAMPHVSGGPKSNVGRHLYGLPEHKQFADSMMENNQGSGLSALGSTLAMAKGGHVPAMVSPGERYLPPSEVEAVAKGKKAPIKAGEKIPGKAKVKGDNLENDTVSKTLKAGGIVIPRSHAEDPKKAAEFVAAILAKKRHK